MDVFIVVLDSCCFYTSAWYIRAKKNELVMHFEIDLLGIYYFLWSICILVSVLAIGNILNELTVVAGSLGELKRVSDALNDFVRELRSVKSSLLAVNKDV